MAWSGQSHHLNRNMRVCKVCVPVLLCCAYQNPLVAFVEIINNDKNKKKPKEKSKCENKNSKTAIGRRCKSPLPSFSNSFTAVLVVANGQWPYPYIHISGPTK